MSSPSMSGTRVALKIDVDTYRGTLDGVPAMLEDLARANVKASFYVSVGPDRSGLAVLRVFTKPGFLTKMLRTNAAKMYGWRTMMYGTLLPSPLIGRRCAAQIRACALAGHEVGLHAWDHVGWQDFLHRYSPARVRRELGQGLRACEEILGVRPRAFAAPAWYCTDEGFLALEELGLDYTSVTRGRESPYVPVVRGRALRMPEVPTTLPTLDEVLGRDGVTPATFNENLLARYRPGATEVLTVHAETEGMAYRGLFQDLLRRHADLGIPTLPVRDVVQEALAAGPLPERAVGLGEVPGRAGKVVVGGAARVRERAG